MIRKKVFVNTLTAVVLMLQFSSTCFGIVDTNVVASASYLRNLIKTKPLAEIRTFLNGYLEENPGLLPDIFWDTQSDSGVKTPLYDLVHRESGLSDHKAVFNLLMSTLKGAYERKGFTSGESDIKTVEWLLENDMDKSRFLEYCVLGCKLQEKKRFGQAVCSKQCRREIIRTVIEILNRYVGPAHTQRIFSALTESGFTLGDHLRDY